MAGTLLMWYAKFLMVVMQKLVTTKNPHGTITNSDLEHAASILQKDIGAHHFDIHEQTIEYGSNHVATVS
jgi:hypothetical protein